MGKFTKKTLEFFLRAVLENFSLFLFSEVTYRLVTFHIQIPLMKNLTSSQMKSNEQKNRFRGIALVFYWLLL